jgi:hypothetical protein
MKSLLLSVCCLLALGAQAQQYSAALEAARYDIDRAWADYDRPSAFRVCLPEESNQLRRMNISDHATIVNAIKAANTVGPEAAMDWLIASQCRNPRAQARVREAGVDAVRYVMNRWGGGEEGIKGYTKAEETPTVTVSFTNKTGGRLSMYSLMTDQADGKRPCSDYKYAGDMLPTKSTLHQIDKGQYLWIRFKTTKDKDGCGTFKKEYKLGPDAAQAVSTQQEIDIQ